MLLISLIARIDNQVNSINALINNVSPYGGRYDGNGLTDWLGLAVWHRLTGYAQGGEGEWLHAGNGGRARMGGAL